ncbi:hypothetical protein [Nonomuraea pusilla]|uniref:hypothetical protein n=1 Tax=Nonomuraea pusilla TaxID=46177 RepID=UPI000ACA3530|nr:hypothetical protein [Nonomuraea pusilla]
MERVREWWTPLIVRDIHLGLHRFDDIAENLGIVERQRGVAACSPARARTEI